MYIANISTHDMNSEEQFNHLDSNSKKLISMCFGCGCQINDQFILRVAPDLEWHAKCLKCAECGIHLDETCTCFVRNGKTYCKLDYVRLFSKKCFKCKEIFQKNDFVMRVSQRIYHIDCFRCCMCTKQLAQGDEFALKDDGLLCKLDNDMFEKHMGPTSTPANQNILGNNSSCQNITNNLQNINPKFPIKCEGEIHSEFEENQNCMSPGLTGMGHQQIMNFNSPIHMQQGRNLNILSQNNQNQRLANNPLSLNSGQCGLNTNSNSSSSSSSMSSSSSSSGGNDQLLHHQTVHNTSHGNSTSSHNRKDKTTRVRTVLNEKQLHTLRTCYGANPRPDALMKEQLVEMTGLSPRVIRVWFQNKRCKDKKKTILIKQMQEQQKNRQAMSHGIPMIASSPMRNDISNLQGGQQIEMQQTNQAYSSMSWKGMVSDFGQGNDSSHGISYDQQIMAGFGSDEEDCFDQMSDAGGGDDSVSSVGLEDSRIQQL